MSHVPVHSVTQEALRVLIISNSATRLSALHTTTPRFHYTLNCLAYFTICHSYTRCNFVLSEVICSISCMHEFNPPWHLSGAWDRNDFWSNCSLLSPLHFKHSLLLVGVAKRKCTKEMREYIKGFTIAALL